MSRKQEIYREFLQFGLPSLRAVRHLRWWQRARRQAVNVEAEFLRNLYATILDPEFLNHDIWFLNDQARWFLAQADPRYVDVPLEETCKASWDVTSDPIQGLLLAPHTEEPPVRVTCRPAGDGLEGRISCLRRARSFPTS